MLGKSVARGEYREVRVNICQVESSTIRASIGKFYATTSYIDSYEGGHRTGLHDSAYAAGIEVIDAIDIALE